MFHGEMSSDQLGGYMDFCSHYKEAINDLIEHGPPQHAWDQVTPGTAEQQGQAEAEGAEELRNIEPEDLDANAVLFQRQSAPLLQRFALETNRKLIPPDNYHELMRGLNTK